MPVNRLRWKDWSTSEQGQRLYRALEPIDTSNLPPVYATFPPNVEYFEDPNVEVGKNYHYVVSAFKDGIEKFSDPLVIDTGVSPLGPGPDELVGNNESAGFFGEVPHAQIINGGALATLAGLYAGSANNNVNWLKFLLDGKILFIPKTFIRSNVSWGDLNACNLIYGDKIIYVKDYAFKIRLIKGRNPNDAIPYQIGHDTEFTWGSEWNRLMYNVAYVHPSDTTQKRSQVGEDWAAYSLSDLNGSSSGDRPIICQEFVNTSGSHCLVRGSRSSISLVGSSAITSNSYWKPVLELVTT